MKKKNWYPLDNAAKIFPAVYGSERPYNFSFSAIMSEPVDKEVLNLAVNNILVRVPTFKTKLKRGLFWYYLENNKKPFVVKSEPENFLGLIDFKQNNDYLFAVYYRDRKITVVCFHALTDGNGMLEVFKEILLEYCRLSGKAVDAHGQIKTNVAPETFNERVDNYVKHYKKTNFKIKRLKNIAHSDGTPFGYDGFGLITATLSITELKQVLKEKGVTITEYFTGIYLYLFYKVYIKKINVKKNNVVILVPVNLRKKYDDNESLRNFTLFARIDHAFTKELSLDECITIASNKIREGSSDEVISTLNYNNVKLEKNILMKLCPLFIKDIAMKIAYHFVGENYQSGDMSNVGKVVLPEELEKYVDDMYFCISGSKTSKQLIGSIGYKDKINVTFTRYFIENDFERNFIKVLTDAGLKVTVRSNYWEKKL